MLGWIPQFFSFFIRSESEGEILSDWGDKIFFPNHKLWFIWRLPNWSEILTSEKNSASFITSHLPCLILQYPGTTEPCEPKPVLVMSRRQAHSVFRWASYRTDLVFPFFTAPTHTMVTHNVCVCVCVQAHNGKSCRLSFLLLWQLSENSYFIFNAQNLPSIVAENEHMKGKYMKAWMHEGRAR